EQPSVPENVLQLLGELFSRRHGPPAGIAPTDVRRGPPLERIAVGDERKQLLERRIRVEGPEGDRRVRQEAVTQRPDQVSGGVRGSPRQPFPESGVTRCARTPGRRRAGQDERG